MQSGFTYRHPLEINRGEPSRGEHRYFTCSRTLTPARNLAPVIVLSAPPSRRIDGTFTDDLSDDDITRRLKPLAGAAHTRNATALVDPVLSTKFVPCQLSGSWQGLTLTPNWPRASQEWLNLVDLLLSSGQLSPALRKCEDVIGAARQRRSSLLLTVKRRRPSNPRRICPWLPSIAAELDNSSFKTLAKKLSPPSY